MRRLVYYIAVSLDGFIAHRDGSHAGFLTEGEHFADLFARYPETIPTHLQKMVGITAKPQFFDTVLMGRHTYEIGLKEGVKSPYQGLEQIVVSRTLRSPHPDVRVISEGVVEFVRELKQRSGKSIWLCGGGQLASLLYSEIDELILKINPFVMGQGIPLFSQKTVLRDFNLSGSKVYDNGFTMLRYTLK